MNLDDEDIDYICTLDVSKIQYLYLSTPFTIQNLTIFRQGAAFTLKMRHGPT
jgi:hypothetical protein